MENPNNLQFIVKPGFAWTGPLSWVIVSTVNNVQVTIKREVASNFKLKIDIWAPSHIKRLIMFPSAPTPQPQCPASPFNATPGNKTWTNKMKTFEIWMRLYEHCRAENAKLFVHVGFFYSHNPLCEHRARSRWSGPTLQTFALLTLRGKCCQTVFSSQKLWTILCCRGLWFYFSILEVSCRPKVHNVFVSVFFVNVLVDHAKMRGTNMQPCFCQQTFFFFFWGGLLPS